MTRHARTLPILLLASLLLGACASGPPMGVERVDPRTAHRHLTANALSSNEPSAPSAQLLRRLALWDRFEQDPEGALAALRAGLTPEGDAERVFALAELSYLHGERSGDRAHLLSAAVYAWAFLFPGEAAAAPEPFDPRLRTAIDLYNRGLAEGLHTGEGELVSLDAGTFELPIGTLVIERATPTFAWAGHELHGFRSAADYDVRGLRNRYRDPGIGAPLAARLRPIGEGAQAPPGAERIPPLLKVPVTALLRIERPRAALAAGRVEGTLEVHSLDDARRVTIAGRERPLEFETTSSLALTLQETEAWAFEKAGFFSSTFRPEALTPDLHGLFFLRPWRPGRIPLVLVHGTASSPARWAELVNELENDPRIWDRYQIWLFIYNTGNPVALSGALLREALTEAMDELDPERRDPGLARTVVIGHSQGGLLTKLTAVDSGDRLWRQVTDEPFEQVEMTDETRSLLRRALFVKPLPFVERVVFVSTPHHGSFLNAVTWAGLRPSALLSRLITLPVDVLSMGADVLGTLGDSGVSLRHVPTSIDNMTPGNPFLETLADIPVAPGITAHSIIPVKGDGPFQEGNDGVVEYVSAHHPGVASELVVQPSGHSTQSHPETIEEIRRILLIHAALPHDEGTTR